MSRLTLQGLAPAPAGEGWLGATLGTLWGLEGLYGRTRPVLFQTLIGTVKSPDEVEFTVKATRFQTLIGTVKSGRTCLGGEVAMAEFQTLIGTVKSRLQAQAPPGG